MVLDLAVRPAIDSSPPHCSVHAALIAFLATPASVTERIVLHATFHVRIGDMDTRPLGSHLSDQLEASNSQ